MGKQRNEFEGYNRDVGFDTVFFYDASKRQEYVCRAYPGAKTSEAKWQIYKLSYNADGTQFKRRYADGQDEFNKICDSYSSYNFTDI